MLDRLVLETDYFRKAQALQELHVENLFYRGLKFQEGDHLAAQVHDGHAAFQLLSSLGKRNATIADVFRILDRPINAYGPHNARPRVSIHFLCSQPSMKGSLRALRKGVFEGQSVHNVLMELDLCDGTSFRRSNSKNTIFA